MPDEDTPNTDSIDDRLERIGRFSRFSTIGLWIIFGAFALAAVGRLPSNLDSASSAIDSMLQPLIFVGMGFLLYAIGMHLHLLHLNLVKQLRSGGDDGM
jgi:hypothetical protein